MWDRSENQIKLIMIRHGATASNKEHRYLGTTDEPLSEEGKGALYKVRKKKLYSDVDYVFSSPMKRCLETAGLLYPNQKPFVIQQWKEMDFGVFEGKNYMDLRGDKRYQEWIDSNGMLPFPEGESREEFTERCAQGLFILRKRLAEAAEKGTIKAAVAIVHGGTIMSLLSSFYGGEYFDYQLPNGCGYVCTVNYNQDYLKVVDLERIDI